MNAHTIHFVPVPSYAPFALLVTQRWSNKDLEAGETYNPAEYLDLDSLEEVLYETQHVSFDDSLVAIEDEDLESIQQGGCVRYRLLVQDEANLACVKAALA